MGSCTDISIRYAISYSEPHTMRDVRIAVTTVDTYRYSIYLNNTPRSVSGQLMQYASIALPYRHIHYVPCRVCSSR